MDRGKSITCLFCGGLLVSIVLFMQCAAKKGQWKAELLFENQKLASSKRTTGHTVVVLPLVTDSCFDTSRALAPEKFSRELIREQESIRLLFQNDFEESIILKHGREMLDSFYAAIGTNDMLALHALDTVWKSLPGEYLLAVRVASGVRINSFDNVVKRKAQLEAELWDIRTIEVVWRAKASGFEMNVSVTDAQFVIDGIKKIGTLLPDFIPVREEENW